MTLLKKCIVRDEESSRNLRNDAQRRPSNDKLVICKATVKSENKEIFHSRNGLKWASNFSHSPSFRTNLSLEERMQIHQTWSNFRHLFHKNVYKSMKLILCLMTSRCDDTNKSGPIRNPLNTFKIKFKIIEAQLIIKH